MTSISVYRRYGQPDWYYRQTAQRPPRPQNSGSGRAQRPPQPQGSGAERAQRPGSPPPPASERENAAPRRETQEKRAPTAGSQKGGLARALGSILPEGLDSGDLFLAAMLLFLYSESHDEDFLIILIVVGLSIFHKDREND